MAPTGPKPGRTPTSVPMSAPRKAQKRFMGWRVTPNPNMSC